MSLILNSQADICASKNHVLTCTEFGYLCECGVFYPLGSFAEENIEIPDNCKQGGCEL